MKHPRHVCGKAHTLWIIILRLLCFRQKITIVTYQILKMVLERIQQDTPKTFWVVAAIGLLTHKCLVPPVSGNYFVHAALCSISVFLVSFSPVYLSQFIFSLCNSSSEFSSFPQISPADCLPLFSEDKSFPYQNSISKSLVCSFQHWTFM